MDLKAIEDEVIEGFAPVLQTELSPSDYDHTCDPSVGTIQPNERTETAKEIRARFPRTDYRRGKTSTEAEDRLYVAAEKGDVVLVKTLLKDRHYLRCGDQVPAMNRPGTRQKSPLIVACSNGQFSVVEELIKAGFDADITNETGRTCLHQACQGGHVKVIELLLNCIDQLDRVDREGFTAAHLCALNGEVRCLQALYDRGASMDVKDKEGRQLAHLAAMRNHSNVLEFLYDIDCDLQCPDDRGRLPVHFAAKHGAISCLVCLVERDCDVILPDKRGWLAMHHAASGNCLDCVRFLIDQGTSIDVLELQRKTPVILAAEHGATTVLHWLLEKGASLNAQDADGNSALHLAAASGHGPAFNCLVSHKANAAKVNSKGEVPFDVAKKNGHPLLIENAAVGKVRCPTCVVKEKHDNWHLAHPMSRVSKDVNSLASRVYTYPESLARTSPKSRSFVPAPRSASGRPLVTSSGQPKGRTNLPKDSTNRQMSTRSLAARYLGEHLPD